MSKQNALAKVEPDALERAQSALLQFTPEQRDLLKRTVARGASDDEFAMFLAMAQRAGLDPFKKEIYFVKNHRQQCPAHWKNKSGDCKCDGEVNIMAGVHGMVSRLTKVRGFGGIQSAVVCQGESCAIDAAGGTVAHTYNPGKRGPVLGAWARGSLVGRLPVVRYVAIDEYRGQTTIWREKPATMIEKVAIMHVARALAPDVLEGIYGAEELGGESMQDGSVRVLEAPTTPAAKQADSDDLTIALALSVIETVPDMEALEAALTGIREDAKSWPPTARRLFASHVERRKVELTPEPQPANDEPPADVPGVVWEDK